MAPIEAPVPSSSASAQGARTRRGWLDLFRPDPPAAVPVTDPDEIRRLTRAWQMRILVGSMVGYALFYFVRKNLSVAMPAMGKDLGITKTELGLFLSLHGVIYGLSKFANGFLGDRANARFFMATGLLLSAGLNVFFGMSSTALIFGLLWMLNGWVQGMGFPPCARLMTHWFSPRVLATKMAIWNTSHSVGAGLVLVLCGYLAEWNWRLCFFVPAAMAIAGALVLLSTLRDSPEAVGLPEPEGSRIARPGTEAGGAAASAEGQATGAEEAESFGRFLKTHVFGNPFIWIVAVANFFVYTVRYAVLDWGPTLLHEAKGFEIRNTGWMVAGFEAAGVIGMLVSGWITDNIFGGRGARTCLFYMAMSTLAVLLFWKLPGDSMAASVGLLCMAGFFIYGPQALVGIIAANLATKRAAATAVGLTGIFGYASTVVSGWGLGTLVEARGWDAGFQGMLAMGVIGTVLFALAWPARAHGYRSE